MKKFKFGKKEVSDILVEDNLYIVSDILRIFIYFSKILENITQYRKYNQRY